MGLNFTGGTPFDLTFRAGDFFAINDKRMALANSVTGNETPEQIAAIGQADKDLSLQAAKAEIDQQVGDTWDAALQQMKKKAWEKHQQHISNGWLFG